MPIKQIDRSGSGGGGTINSASNVNVGGVGVFNGLVGDDLQFRGINALTTAKIAVTFDDPNNEIDLDVVESNFAIGTDLHASVGVMDYLFSTGILDNDPTDGKFKMNGSTLTPPDAWDITKIWFDNLDNTATEKVNQVRTLKKIISGWKIAIMNAAMSSTYGIVTISSTVTDKTGYQEFTCTYVGTSRPANNEACKLLWIGKGLETALLVASDLVRVTRDGSNNVNGLQDKDGNQIAGQRQVANYAALPNATLYPRETWRLLDSNLDYTNDGVNTYWYPQNKICTFLKSTSLKSVTVPAATFTSVTMSNNAGTMRLTSAGVHGLTNAAVQGRQIYVSAWSGDGVPGLYTIADVDGATTRIDLTAAYSATAGNPTITLAGTGQIPIWEISVHPLTPTSSLDWNITTENINSTNTKRIIINFGGVELYNLNQNGTGNIINRVDGGINNQNDTDIQRTNFAPANASGAGTTTTASTRTTINTDAAQTWGLYYVIATANEWMECSQLKLRMTVA